MFFNIILGILIIIVIFLYFVVFKLVKRLTSLYDLIYSRTSGIPVGEHIPITDFLSSELSGTQVLLFGKPTCPDCRKLLKQIQKEKLHQSINISVLYQDSESEKQEYSQQKDFSFPIKTITKEQKSLFKIEVVPYTYVIDKQGTVRYKGVLSSREIVNAYKSVQATTEQKYR